MLKDKDGHPRVASRVDILGGLAALVAILAFSRTVLVDFHTDTIAAVRQVVNERTNPLETDIRQIKLDLSSLRGDLKNAKARAREELIMEQFNSWMNQSAPGYKQSKSKGIKETEGK